MPGTTTNRANRFPSGTDAVNVPQDIQNLATDLDNNANIYSGTLASRPAASAAAGHGAANPGSLWLATDTDQLFISQGGNWREIPIGAVGGLPINTVDIVNAAVDYTKGKLSWGIVSIADINGTIAQFDTSIGSVVLNPTVPVNILGIGFGTAVLNAAGTSSVLGRVNIDGVTGKQGQTRGSNDMSATMTCINLQSVAAGSRTVDFVLSTLSPTSTNNFTGVGLFWIMAAS